MKPCPTCGAAVANKARDCGSCGATWQAEAGAAPSSPDVRPEVPELDRKRARQAAERNREMEWWRHVIHGPFELVGAGGHAAVELFARPVICGLFVPTMAGGIGYQMAGWPGLVGGIVGGFAIGGLILFVFSSPGLPARHANN